MFGVQFRKRGHFLRVAQHIHRAINLIQFLLAHRREAGIHRRGANGVCHDFIGHAFLLRADGADAAAQVSTLMQ
jgi:hypothetical protein